MYFSCKIVKGLSLSCHSNILCPQRFCHVHPPTPRLLLFINNTLSPSPLPHLLSLSLSLSPSLSDSADQSDLYSVLSWLYIFAGVPSIVNFPTWLSKQGVAN